MSISLEPGTVLAHRYEAIRELGAGGMGEVWCCLDRRLQQEVALKRVRARHMDGSRLARKIQQFFIEEVRALASLSHPNLVRALDFGQLADASPFLVMEFIDGLSLDHIWKHEQILPWHLLAAIVDQLLSGLAHIHSRGILHRDLKPANILLGRGDQDELRVFLVDFGIAIVDHALDDFRPKAVLESQSLPTIGLGTPPYIAPEQILSQVHYRGPCTDLHAIGILLYQFSSGELPYWSEKPGDMIQNVVYQPPPMLRPVNQAPPEIPSMLQQLMAKIPWERGSFAAILRKVLRPLWNPQLAHREWLRLLWRRGESMTDSYDRHPSIEEDTPVPHSTHTSGHDLRLHLPDSRATDDTMVLLHTKDASRSSPEVSDSLLVVMPSSQEGGSAAGHTLSWGARIPRVSTMPGESRFLSTLLDEVPSDKEAANHESDGADSSTSHTGEGHSLSLLSLQIPSVVGREKEQQELWEQVEAVCQGARRMVVLEGPAGIGKSRLAQWLQEQTHEHGLLLGLKARLGHGSSPYASGILGAIEQYLCLEQLDKAGLEKALQVRWGKTPAMHQLIDGLVELLRPTPYEMREPQHLACHRPHRRNQLLLQALQQLSLGMPLYIWLDDLQYVDEESATLLMSLLEEGPPVLLLGTYQPRSEEAKEGEAFLAAFFSQANAQMLPLARLSEQALEQLLLALLPLAPTTATALASGSDGNPLFLIQQLFNWLQRGQLVWLEERRWYAAPASLHQHIAESRKQLWQERLEALSPVLQQAARAATTLGQTFSLALLERLLEELGLSPTLSHALLSQQLLVLEREHCSWSHDLIEVFVRHSLDQQPEAPDVYLAAARVLAEHPLHFTRHIVRLRVTALLRAGQIEDACEVLLGFLENAWKTRRNAVQLRADLALLPAQIGPIYEAHRWRWEAEIALLSSDHDQAELSAKQALAAYQAQGDEGGLAEICRILGAIASGRSQYKEALSWLTQALEGAEQLDMPETVAHVQLLLAQTHQFTSQLHESAQFARKAYSLAEQWNINTVLVQSCLIQATTHHDLGEHTEARLWAEISLDACRLGGELYGEGQAHVLLAWLDLVDEQGAEALAHCDAAIQCFRDIDEWWWQSSTQLTRGWVHCWQGESKEALALAADTRAAFESRQMTHEPGQTWLLTAAAQLQCGALSKAKAALQAAQASQRPEAMMRQPLALLEAWLAQSEQRPAEAQQALFRAISIWQQLGLTTWGVPRLLRAIQPFAWPASMQAQLDAWLASFA